MKKQEHSGRVRIRNNLVAQYFPELDRFWNNAAAENLAIVRGYLVIAWTLMKRKEFFNPAHIQA